MSSQPHIPEDQQQAVERLLVGIKTTEEESNFSCQEQESRRIASFWCYRERACAARAPRCGSATSTWPRTMRGHRANIRDSTGWCGADAIVCRNRTGQRHGDVRWRGVECSDDGVPAGGTVQCAPAPACAM